MKEFEKIEIDTIHVGSCYSAPVYFEDGTNMFLPGNRPAKQYHVDVLKKWHIPYLLSVGKEIEPPVDGIETLEAEENV